MTQELYQKAMKFAGEKHSEQKVPGTKANYLLHISNVTMEVIMAHKADPCFDLDFVMQTAILHDTIEDTSANYDEIKELFGENVANAVEALTKDDSLATKEEKMQDSLDRINALEKEVGIVKLADRITNLQKPPANWSEEKVKKYAEEAQLIADTLGDKNEYLANRIQSKILAYREY